MEIIAGAINDSSDVHCFDMNLIIIFAKSMKAERCINVMFKLRLHIVYVTVEDLNL